MRWTVDATWNHQRRTFKIEAPTIELAIEKTKTEAGILWGCRASAVDIFAANRYEGPRVRVTQKEAT
jgi:hypothetical protein